MKADGIPSKKEPPTGCRIILQQDEKDEALTAVLIDEYDQLKAGVTISRKNRKPTIKRHGFASQWCIVWYIVN